MLRETIKIVRSRIPHLAEQSNNPGNFESMILNKDNTETIDVLFREKISEEAGEVQLAVTDAELIFELADLQQAIREFMKFRNISEEDLELIIKAKKYTNGSYVYDRCGDTNYVYVLKPDEEINGK